MKAFTLIESLIVIGIIFILLLIGVLNWSKIKKELALYRSSHKLAQDLRRIESLAMAGRCNPCVALFDLSQKESYFIEGKRIFLEEGVEIESIFPESFLKISFYPPLPKILVNGKEFERIEIILTNKISKAKIHLNFLGKIEIY